MIRRGGETLGLALLAALGVVVVSWALWGHRGGAARPPLEFGAGDLERLDPAATSDDPWLAPDPVAAERAAADEPQDAPLVRLGLRGRVVDVEGRPIAGAEVRWALYRLGGRALRLRAAATTGPDGTFAFDGAAPSHPRLVLVARHDAFAPTVVERRLSGADDALDLGDVVLAAGGAIVGRVLGPGATPVAGTELRLRPAGGNELDRLEAWRELLPAPRVRPDGRFAVERLPAGSYRLQAWAPGLQRVAPETPTIVREGEVTDVGELVLARGYRLAGVVLDPLGAPREGATVRVRDAPSAGRGLSVRAVLRTDALGRFELDHLPDRPLRVEVDAAGCLSWAKEPVVVTTGAELRVQLVAGLALSGRVIDAVSGAPLTRYTSSVREVNPDLEDLETPPVAPPDGLAPPRDHVRGEFVERGLDVGRYVVEAYAPGYVFARSPVVELRADAPAAPLELRLVRGRTVAGHVVDAATGAPLAAARVELRVPPRAAPPATVAVQSVDGPEDEPVDGVLARTAITDTDGAFEFDDLAAAEVFLVARRAGFVTFRGEPFALAESRAGLRVELDAPAVLTGRVAGSTATSERAHVLVYGGVGRLQVVRAAIDGDYRVEGLAPGAYLVRACSGDPRDGLVTLVQPHTDVTGRPLASDVVLRAGEQRELPLVVQAPLLGGVSGVLRVDGAAAGGWRVTVIATQPDASLAPRFVGRHVATVTRADGSFRLDAVPAGARLLRFTPRETDGGASSFVREVNIAAGEVRSLALDL
ncbi:MAG: carboxypeptidase regulatory-like domain-containing protein [Planctomycetes bacterium]|nr:carboxypeptidase regulatory-like domain-containing protein [Planctomycetota bacterium]